MLARLIAADAPIGGQRLANELQVTRSAIWKQIEALRSSGLTIESGRPGYRLEEWTEALQSIRLQRFLHILAPSYAANLRLLQSTDSTNSEAKRMAGEGWPDRSLVIAGRQTQGRGRLGRIWASDDAGGLYLSILLRPRLSPEDLMPMTLLTALAVRDTFADFLPEEVGLKWPNDIIYEGQKICGILCESVLEDAGIKQLVIGIGVNINQESFPDELSDKAISMRQITKLAYDPNYFVAKMLSYFEMYYEKFFMVERRFDSFLTDYRSSCLTLGKKVMVQHGEDSYEATATSITREGYLVLTLTDGKEEIVGSGEVSVRGLLGYT